MVSFGSVAARVTCVLAAVLLAVGIATRAEAAPRPVQLNILVVEADKAGKGFPERLAPYKDGMPGFTGGKLLDELNTATEEGSSVSLEILKQSGESRILKVTVRKVEADSTVKLRVAIAALKLQIDTTHEKSGTVIVAHELSKQKALFLVITPKVVATP